MLHIIEKRPFEDAFKLVNEKFDGLTVFIVVDTDDSRTATFLQRVDEEIAKYPKWRTYVFESDVTIPFCPEEPPVVYAYVDGALVDIKNGIPEEFKYVAFWFEQMEKQRAILCYE